MKSVLTLCLPTITRLYPFNVPRARILDCLPKIPNSVREFKTKNGQFIVDCPSKTDFVCKSLYWLGEFDPWISHTLRLLAHKGDTVCDIGANIGATALVLGQSVGASGRVICFEAIPRIALALENNVNRNGMKNIEINALALSNEIGTLQMEFNPDQTGHSCITPTPIVENVCHVDAVTFDHWEEENPLGQIAVAKIDVEGHESAVFAGMEGVLRSGRMSSMLFEHKSEPEPIQTTVFDMLGGYGYVIYRICKGLRRTHYSELSRSAKGRLTSDFVAVLPGTQQHAIMARTGS